MTGVQPIVASYTCHEGATLVGSEMRICQEDGSWSGEEPSCRTGSAQTIMYTKNVAIVMETTISSRVWLGNSKGSHNGTKNGSHWDSRDTHLP